MTRQMMLINMRKLLIIHFKKDPKRAFAILSLFLATGLLIIIYLNQYDPQPRERDYSFVGSFFALVLSFGGLWLLDDAPFYGLWGNSDHNFFNKYKL